ncbi:phosphoadenosine phosphosulfate reductase domain-containing protein [Halomonas sp. 86]|uniref:phosphoadenosine phosphosulfate reductase domain-containing protein n=1 Tax=unclassified Halomonas TaxID=2609666 RepID=UPI0040348DA7
MMNATLTTVSANAATRHAAIHHKAEAVIQRIQALIQQNYTLGVAESYGKDSLTVLVLFLEALRRCQAAGEVTTHHYVTNSNTGIENPAMSVYTEAMNAELDSYCQRQGLPVTVVEVEPSIASSFAYSTIGRGQLPVFAGASRSCSIDWKLRPQQKAIKQLVSRQQSPGNLVVLIGTRYAESADREKRMVERGENESSLVQQPGGHFTFAPIADWEVGDVWSLLLAADRRRDALYPTFCRDFSWTFELYRDGNEGVCGLLAGEQTQRSPCQARFGCSLCLATGSNDRSMEAMISSAPETHGHLAGVNRLRQFLLNTRWDMSRRENLGRKVSDAGYIGVAPTNYSAEMRLDLLRYLLTLDIEEEERAIEHDGARANGELPAATSEAQDVLSGRTFQFITPRQLIAIDFAWSLSYGFPTAFPALKVWYEVRVMGKRYPIPDVAPVEKQSVPPMVWYPIPDGKGPAYEMGLTPFDRVDSFGALASRTIQNRYTGQPTKSVFFEEADELTIDAMEAMLFVDAFDEDRYLAAAFYPGVDSARVYLDQGIVKLPKGKASIFDSLARRKHYFERLAFHSWPTNVQEVLQSGAISAKEHDLILASLQKDQCNDRGMMDMFDAA